MKTETKQELKDRIAELELRILQVQDSEHKKRVEIVKERMAAESKALNATIAAYACLAVIFGIVVYTFGVNPW